MMNKTLLILAFTMAVVCLLFTDIEDKRVVYVPFYGVKRIKIR